MSCKKGLVLSCYLFVLLVPVVLVSQWVTGLQALFCMSIAKSISLLPWVQHSLFILHFHVLLL